MRNPCTIRQRFHITCLEDIVSARESGCCMAEAMGCSSNQKTIAATAISELARNMLLHASCGEIMLGARQAGAEASLVVEAVDFGPGIVNIDRAMCGSHGSPGYGLSGVRDMVDEFVISSHAGEGTVVTVEIRMHRP